MTKLHPSFMGVESGCLAVLHTWGQSLNYHPHIHMLVPAGRLDPDGLQWIHAHKKFFVPVKALSSIFRGVFLEKLGKALDHNLPRIPEKQARLFADPRLFKQEAYSKLWHVYIKKTFKGANQVVSYLGRYLPSGRRAPTGWPISNSRILGTDGGTVKCRWKDYRDNKNKTMELKSEEFIRRFMRHILPGGFYKIRYYGIMSSALETLKTNIAKGSGCQFHSRGDQKHPGRKI